MTPAGPVGGPRLPFIPTLARAGLVTAIVDGLWASVLSVVYYSSVTRVFQGVAATLLGPSALTGGTRTALVGVAMHVGVAFGWSAVFLLLITRWRPLRELAGSRNGVLKVAALYGPLVWVVMSWVVIPLLVHRLPTIGVRWWVQLLGHVPFVGLPIVGMTMWQSPRQPAARVTVARRSPTAR